MRRILFALAIIFGAIRAFGRWLDSIASEIFGLAAIALIGYGAWLIYHPSGFISAGTVLLVLVLIGQLRRN